MSAGKTVEGAVGKAGSARRRLPVCLIIMDGFGLADSGEGNAISLARKPCLDGLFENHPPTKLEASGEAVGLPEGQMGNSEVGHLNIGAGRVVFQELTRINHACRDGSIGENRVINDAMDSVKPNGAVLPDGTALSDGAVLHIMGLLSDGGVHSSSEHLYALLRHAREREVPRIHIHCFLDGRDVPPTSGKAYLADLERVVAEVADGTTAISIASIEGRYYSMDRDNRWDRVKKAFDAIVCGEPVVRADPQSFVQASYEEGITDEFIVPAAFDPRGIRDGDAVIFFNFRPDRAREITRAIVDRGFKGFERHCNPDVRFVCLTEYDPTIDAPIAFEKEFPEQVLADVLSQAGLKQYHIAETEKYAHVTFFLNGGIEEAKPGESRVLVPSPQVATYDLQPEMSEPEVADTLAAAIDAGEADVYIVNFANCDMVGHTGSIPAAIKAVEAVDEGVCKVLAALERKQGIALLTADHGNADKMLDEDGEPFTAHTTAPVPLVLIDYSDSGLELRQEHGGSLCNIAPTLLDIIGLSAPEEMTAESYLAK